jgi:membrane protease YdiL (CAAX protease family)
MTNGPGASPSFSTTLWLLLKAARMRSAGRRKRARELLRQRSRGGAFDWSGSVNFIGIIFSVLLSVMAAYLVQAAVRSGQRFETERQGKIVVSSRFLEGVREAEAYAAAQAANPEDDTPHYRAFRSSYFYESEARDIADDYGGSKSDIEGKLREAVRTRGSDAFISNDAAAPGLDALIRSGPLPGMLGSLALLWWIVLLVFQGEGLELDLQRRRHPLWEWLFSHPVPPGAIFLSESLSPLAANPVYWCAPVYAGFLYGFIYGPESGFVAAFLVGVPMTIAAACVGKALEIGIILRCPPRTRGAIIGLMSWLGYASLVLVFVGRFFVPHLVTNFGRFLDLFTFVSWPWLRLFLGGKADGSFSLLSGVFTCWLISLCTVAGAVWFTVWGTQQGLAGNFGRAQSRPSIASDGKIRFGKDPLYLKEFLWFIRDRSAIVQTILIPLTVASFQMFNLRGLFSEVQAAWNYLCGAAIMFGTYFLWVLGPKSLASEGTALWIALTWPRGLESLLQAKAWLWSLISSVMVALVLAYAIYLFPTQTWKILLVGVGWFLFGRSMAEKSVTLVTVTSSSGEPEQVPRGRRYAAQLGMLTFSIGVLTQQWHLAIMGIVYSSMTAAAMWQNFRARLPYLYDPWSEQLPKPPTLMHAMIAISIMVEFGAVVVGIVMVAAGRENLAIAQAVGYAVCAVAVSLGTASFLGGRGVSNHDVWRWESTQASAGTTALWPLNKLRNGQFLMWCLWGVAGGVALGLFADGYTEVLRHIPATEEILRKSHELMSKIPNLRLSYEVMAIAFAPFAEEYLFRGLLYRALDREWGGWRAVVGSAAFFAVYHSPLAWLPVFLLGVSNALLFKKTGRLFPAVILHMVYNAIVLR